jgi:ubiquinone/menaquinone biosynthesis C-methylase UbiE
MATKTPPKTLPTSERIQDALYGFTRSQLVFAAVSLDVFTMVDEGHKTMGQMLRALEAAGKPVDLRAIRIFLDGLVGVGFLSKANDAYGLPDDIRTYLSKHSPQYMGGMVTHCQGLYQNWTQLAQVVQTGLPAGGSQGLADVEAFYADLVQGLYVSNYPTAHRLAQWLGMGTKRKAINILDVAGGSGVWSIGLLENDPHSQATLLDYPTVVQVAQNYIHKHHLRDRYRYLPADIETLEFPQGQFDMAILGNICHAIGPNATQALVKKVAGALKPQGEMVIIDFVPDDERSKASWPLIFGVNMLILTPEGDVFTQANYAEWFEDAGCHLVESQEIEPDVTAIVGRRGLAK